MKHWPMIITAVIIGTCARLIMLKIDYRQYPGYPHGYIIHLTLGFIAAALGGLVIPALIEESYVAVTFLALAAQQFRAVREAEREFLQELEETELVKRGQAYIEGISKVFEARNYLAMITAFITTCAYYLLSLLNYFYLFNLFGGIFCGGLVAYLLYLRMSEKTVGDIAQIEVVNLEFEGPNEKNIAIEKVVIMNVGLNESIQKWQKEGLGVIIAPKDDNARATLANTGQRQAIIHDVATQLGIQLDLGVQDYTPLARLNLNTGRVYLIIIPIEKDKKCIKEAVSNTPILEGVKRRPLDSKVGREAAD